MELEDNNPLTPEIVQDYIRNREEEIILQKQELELAKQQDSNSYNYACKALELQAEELKEERKAKERIFGKVVTTFIFLVVLFIFFCWLLVYYHQQQLLYEILKFLGYTVPTGIGGYYYGKNKKDKE